MKLLHILPSLQIGGAQKLVGDLLPLLARKDNLDVKVLVFQKTGSEIEDSLIRNGIELINLDTSLRSLSAIGGLRKHIKDADVVHVHLFPANYFAAIANIGINKPLVYTEHSTHNKRRDHNWLRQIEKLVYGKYKRILCISSQTKSALSNWLGKEKGKDNLIVIENGINPEAYRISQSDSPSKLFGRDGIPLLMVSRFVESKDQATVVKALQYVRNKDIFIVFVGDGPTRNEIEKLAESLNLKDRVVFMGTRNDIPEIISASAIGVQSSHWEGFGLTAIEMMAGGLPVIASDVEGLKQVVENYGLIFEKGNERKLAGLIDKISSDESFYLQLKENSLKRAADFSILTTADKYYEIYSGLK